MLHSPWWKSAILPSLPRSLSMTDVESTLKRISSHPGVEGVIILAEDETPVRSTFDPELTSKYAHLVSSFSLLSRSAVRDLDPTVRPSPRPLPSFSTHLNLSFLSPLILPERLVLRSRPLQEEGGYLHPPRELLHHRRPSYWFRSHPRLDVNFLQIDSLRASHHNIYLRQ
jgi:hypothetical protein